VLLLAVTGPLLLLLMLMTMIQVQRFQHTAVGTLNPLKRLLLLMLLLLQLLLSLLLRLLLLLPPLQVVLVGWL
jgi:hypothetical protein